VVERRARERGRESVGVVVGGGEEHSGAGWLGSVCLARQETLAMDPCLSVMVMSTNLFFSFHCSTMHAQSRGRRVFS
jgi:hypothetical protein